MLYLTPLAIFFNFSSVYRYIVVALIPRGSQDPFSLLLISSPVQRRPRAWATQTQRCRQAPAPYADKVGALDPLFFSLFRRTVSRAHARLFTARSEVRVKVSLGAAHSTCAKDSTRFRTQVVLSYTRGLRRSSTVRCAARFYRPRNTLENKL